MKLPKDRVAAFSLIELTLALGIAALCLLAVMGLIPIAVQTNRNATSQTAVTGIIASVIADMRDRDSGNVLGTQLEEVVD